MKNPIISCVFLLPAVLGFIAGAHAAEHKVSCDSLPAAVQRQSKAFLQDGATVRGCVKDVSGGETTYEMELLTKGGSKDVTFNPGGDVVEVEEQIAPSALPSVVAAAFWKAAQGGKVEKIESLTRKGKLIGYESTMSRNGKRRELAFHPDGSVMKAD